jgi:Rab-GTPase-TBC domain
MLATPQFWHDENDSPLLARNFHFVKKENVVEMTARVASWADLCKGYLEVEIEEDQYKKCDSEEFLRIFRKDAERTYVPKHDPEQHERTLTRHEAHINILRTVVAEVKDYHQGMGYIAAFLGLFLEPVKVSKIMIALHREGKYSKGYFSATPQRFVADAHVVNRILAKRRPALHAHFSKNGVLPEMYATKWFVGLGLHVLPYSALFDFYELYFEHGNTYLFRFAIAYIEAFEKELLVAKDTAAIMTILRAEDPKCDWKPTADMIARHESEDLFGKIVRAAVDIDLDVDLDAMRDEEGVRVAEVVERARKRDQELKDMYSDDEIVFSDEEDE